MIDSDARLIADWKTARRRLRALRKEHGPQARPATVDEAIAIVAFEQRVERVLIGIELASDCGPGSIYDAAAKAAEEGGAQ